MIRWIMFLLSLWVLEVNGFDVPAEVWFISGLIVVISLIVTTADIVLTRKEGKE